MLKLVNSFLSFKLTCSLIGDIKEEVIAHISRQSLYNKIQLLLFEKMVASSNKLGHYILSMIIDRLIQLNAIFNIPFQRTIEQID